MNLSKKIIGGLTLAGIMTLTGAIGFAQQGVAPNQESAERTERKMHRGGKHGMRGGGMGRFWGNLNLTDAQKQQMGQIAARYRESGKAMREQMRGQRDGFDSFTDGTFDEAAVRAAAQRRATARVEMEVAHARMMSEMYAVLTPEQKAQLAAERKEREQRRQEFRSRRQANQGQSL